MVRVTVEDAKRLIREASPLEAFVNVYVSPDGGIEARREECRAPYLEADFPGLLQSLGIVPRHKWRPHITQYAGGDDYDDLQYTVTRDEAQRVAEAFGVSLDAAPAPSASAPAVARPEPVAAPAEAVPAKWWEAVLPHMVETLKAGRFRSAKEFHRALEVSSGSPGSPFEKVQGELRVRDFDQPVALKTIQNRWKEVRAAAGLR